MRIILASSSPRRKMMMDLLNIHYEIIPSNSEEKLESDLPLEEQCKRIAYMKAKNVFDRTNGNRIVIGADTMVIKDNKLYGKPKNKIDAKEMLYKLKNSSNTIITGLAVFIKYNNETKEYVDIDSVKVYLSDMSEEEIDKWILSGNALDKAGAYSVDPHEKFCMFINKIEGNLATSIGLPFNLLYKYIKEYI